MDEKELLIDIRGKIVGLEERMVGIEEKIKNANKTNDLKLESIKENLEEKIKVADNRLKDLEDSNKWLWRAVAGGLISAAITFLINYK